jgi:hypothetical protein
VGVAGGVARRPDDPRLRVERPTAHYKKKKSKKHISDMTSPMPAMRRKGS